MGFLFPSQNWPKSNFSVGVIKSQGNSNSQGISFPKPKSTKIQFFSWFNKSQGNFNSQGISFPKLKIDQNPIFQLVSLNLRGIPIPMGFLFPSQNWPKSNSSVGVINPRGSPIPMGIVILSEHLFNSQRYSNSHGNSFPNSKSAKIQFFSWCNKSQGNSNSQGSWCPKWTFI